MNDAVKKAVAQDIIFDAFVTPRGDGTYEDNAWNFNSNNLNCNNNDKNNYNNNYRVREFSSHDVFPLEDYFKAYYECRKNKRRTVNQLEFEFDYEVELVKLYNDINNGQYRIGTCIRFPVTKPKLREVFAATFRDRVVHHLIMMRLNPLFESVFINDAYNCRTGKGVLYGIHRLYDMIKEASEDYTKDVFIGTWDLKGFFMSIDKYLLYTLLKEFIDSNYHNKDKQLLLKLIKLIVLNKPLYNCVVKGKRFLDKLPQNKSLVTCGDDKGLPIGNLTSQVFANFFLTQFDKYVLYKFKYYGRYVDDFFIIDENVHKLSEFTNSMSNFLKHIRITLNTNKVNIQPYYHGVRFIGYVVKKKRVYMKNQTIGTIYKKIHSAEQHLCKKTVCKHLNVLNSYFGFLKHIFGFNVKLKIAQLMCDKWNRFIKLDYNLNKFILL